MEDEIHFLVNELEGELHTKVQSILRDLEKPVEKKDNIAIKKFTRALVHATARRVYARQPQFRQRQPRLQTDAFAQLKQLERHPLPPPRLITPQRSYYTPVMPAPPQPTAQARSEQPQTISPTTQQPHMDGFLPSGLPPKPPEQKIQRMPTDETLTGTPESFAQYKLPLPSEIPRSENNQSFKPSQLQPAQQLPPSPTILAPAPIQTSIPPIAITVPQGIEPPIALIVDAESKKPIVTVSIQNDVYTVAEPPLTPEEINMVTWLRKKFTGKEKKIANKKKLNKKIWKSAKKMNFSMQKNDDNEHLKIKYYLVKHLMQFGWVEPLLHDEAVTKIRCDGENIPLIIVRKEKTLKTNITFPAAEHINRFLIRFAGRVYKKVSEKNPLLDFTANDYHIEGSLKTATTPARFTLTRVL